MKLAPLPRQWGIGLVGADPLDQSLADLDQALPAPLGCNRGALVLHSGLSSRQSRLILTSISQAGACPMLPACPVMVLLVESVLPLSCPGQSVCLPHAGRSPRSSIPCHLVDTRRIGRDERCYRAALQSTSRAPPGRRSHDCRSNRLSHPPSTLSCRGDPVSPAFREIAQLLLCLLSEAHLKLLPLRVLPPILEEIGAGQDQR